MSLRQLTLTATLGIFSFKELCKSCKHYVEKGLRVNSVGKAAVFVFTGV